VRDSAAKIDFCFSVLQTAVGYCTFTEGISKLKQVTGRDHHTVQHYIIGVIAGRVPHQFLVVIRALLDFWYLAQALCFTDHSLGNVEKALQEFHDNQDAIVQAGAWKDSWTIPKLELLQSIFPSVCLSGALMQWSADVTELTHVQEIKIPARAGNNQNYYSQIVHYCYDHVQLRVLSGHSGRIAALQLSSGCSPLTPVALAQICLR